jgi:hypothetical protein
MPMATGARRTATSDRQQAASARARSLALERSIATTSPDLGAERTFVNVETRFRTSAADGPDRTTGTARDRRRTFQRSSTTCQQTRITNLVLLCWSLLPSPPPAWSSRCRRGRCSQRGDTSSRSRTIDFGALDASPPSHGKGAAARPALTRSRTALHTAGGRARRVTTPGPGRS